LSKIRSAAPLSACRAYVPEGYVIKLSTDRHMVDIPRINLLKFGDGLILKHHPGEINSAPVKY
jgi:hypothetical protein